VSDQLKKTLDKLAEAAAERLAAEEELDQAGGYHVVQDVLSHMVNAQLNIYWRRGWKLVTIYRGHGGENLVLFKEPK